MPSAQVLPDGETAWTFGYSELGSVNSLTFQMLPRLETTVHFTSVDVWEGGAPLYDQSIDLKYQLLDENGMWPAIAIGFRDFLSNGAYSSEYLVATKTLGYGLTVTGGFGWGRLGSYNPIASFGTRPPATSTGLDYDQFFKGDVGIFGGVQWDTPINGVTFKAEYSSDAYLQENTFSGYTPSTPFNFGIEYEPFRGVSLGAYYLNGEQYALRLTFSGNPNRPIVSPDLGAGPVPVNARPAGYDTDTTWTRSQTATDSIAKALIPALSAEGMSLEQARIQGDTIELYVRNNTKPQEPKAIGRLARMLTLALPPSIEVFRITPVSGGVATTTVEIRRSDLEAQAETTNAGPESFATTRFYDAENNLGEGAWVRDPYPDFSWSLNPRVPVNFGDATSSASFDLLLNATARYQLSRAFSLSGSVNQLLYSSDSDEEIGGPTLARLTADYVTKLSPTIYGRLSGGYLDGNYVGVDGEILWKPANQNWGLGLEIAAVQRRDSDSFFGLDDYQTITGHGSVYWDTGFYGLEAQVDVGVYLEGDLGTTLTLGRRFDNGWEVSGYMTVTDADTDAFSQGIKVRIPLRWTMPNETRSTFGVSLDSSTDSGNRLGISNRLYPMIRDYDVLDFYESWGSYWQ